LAWRVIPLLWLHEGVLPGVQIAGLYLFLLREKLLNSRHVHRPSQFFQIFQLIQLELVGFHMFQLVLDRRETSAPGSKPRLGFLLVLEGRDIVFGKGQRRVEYFVCFDL
jgi:hypothetical protein